MRAKKKFDIQKSSQTDIEIEQSMENEKEMKKLYGNHEEKEQMNNTRLRDQIDVVDALF